MLLIISRTIVELIGLCSGFDRKKIDSISAARALLTCAMALSNSKSAEVLNRGRVVLTKGGGH